MRPRRRSAWLHREEKSFQGLLDALLRMEAGLVVKGLVQGKFRHPKVFHGEGVPALMRAHRPPALFP